MKEPARWVPAAALTMLLSTGPGWAAIPVLNSDYSAPHVLYLDFDGHYEPASNYRCPDGRPAGWTVDFMTTDVSGQITADQVRAIWQAVAEDFAPFRVNVTTDPRYEPDPDSPESPKALRVAIGPSSLDSLGLAPAICGESPLEDPPYLDPNISNVAVVHLDPYAIKPRDTAKKISHEAGHVYGLAHHTAAPAALEDWIMAPLAPATRYIWRVGTNEQKRLQNDVAHLASLLGLRADELQPSPLRTTGPSVSGGAEVLYAHGTLTDRDDFDDFSFASARAGLFEFKVSPGIWASPQSPMPGAEPNAKYQLVIKDASGRQTIVCPSQQTFTMSVTTQPTLGLDCLNHPPALSVGVTYRLRVYHGGPNRLPGNIGRYTVTVRDVTPRPELPMPMPRSIGR
ncbi:MAG TPA: hypothetical protein VF210_03845 [Pseudomonadales bacterium]